MPQWLDRLDPPIPPPKCIYRPSNKPSLAIVTSKDTQDSTIQTTMTTPTTSTAVESSLPPPAVQSIASSSRSRRLRKKTVRVAGLSVHWAQFKKRISTAAAPSSSSAIGEGAAENSYTRQMETKNTEVADYLDEVVVDRSWTEEIKSSVSHSEHNGSPEKSGGSHQPNQGTSDHDSAVYDGFLTSSGVLATLRWRTWPFIMEIFSSRFVDERSEQHYAQVRIFLLFLPFRLAFCKILISRSLPQESWFIKKSLALWASLWLIANWVLGCIFIPHNPIAQLDKVFYFGVSCANPLFATSILKFYDRSPPSSAFLPCELAPHLVPERKS